jgi:hypothetical protein
LKIFRTAYPTRIPPLRRLLLRREAIGRTFFSTATEYRTMGRRWMAANRVLWSLAAWPFPSQRPDIRPRLNRLKFLAALAIAPSIGHQSNVP